MWDKKHVGKHKVSVEVGLKRRFRNELSDRVRVDYEVRVQDHVPDDVDVDDDRLATVAPKKLNK